MQITITQVEIETAIRNHVLGLIAVRENMRIDIELKATRKEDGYTAVIDITPEGGPGGGEPVEDTKPAVKEAPVKEVTKTEAKAETPKAEPKPKAETVEAAAEEEPAPVKEPVKPLFGKKASTAPTKEPEVQAAEKEDNTAPFEADKPTVRKIFTGLTKPVNEKPEAA